MDDGGGGRESEDKGPTKMAAGSTSESPLVLAPCVLVPGESVSHVGTTRDGNCIVLTNYRLYASSSVKAGEESAGGAFINVPLSCVESVEARDLFFIHVMCKDSRYYRVSFSDNAACEDWQRRLLTAINMQSSALEDSFACVHFKWALEAQFEELEEDYGSHASLSDTFCDTFRHEVARLGFDLNVAWRMSPVNKDLSFCPTYPPEILVPNCIDDKILVKVASFRSARRVPAVVWRHGITGAVLARCSQPEVGWLGWRSADDEALVRAIADASAYDQPGSQSLTLSDDLGTSDEKADVSSIEGVPSLKDLSAEVAATVAKNAKVLIVDARSYPAAVGNRARGGGVECIEYYPFAEIIFMSLGNIHNIRKSFQALRSLCNQTPAEAFSGGSGWLAALDATKWLYHISGLIKAATRVATAMHNEGRSVVVHCSDGWDRTPQIVSLAQLMLDPYYRSIDGFRTLVEICWLDFGHKMADRNGTILGVDDPNERAPIFLQWLDCVHQLLLQFPCHFEFNLSFLVKLAQHTYSSLFGTFLCNFLSERRRLKVAEKTRSVWDYLDHHQVKFRNFLYEGRMPKRTVDPFWPRCEVRDLLLWKDVYVVSDLKSTLSPSPALAPSSGSTNNNASTASSSGMNSRCDDAPGSDQVDSGANSSKEEEENPKNDLKMVRDELKKLEEQNNSIVNGSEGSNSRSTTNNYDSDLTICDTNQRASLMGAVAQLRLGQQARAIESSTDTLVADVDERQVSHESAATISSDEKPTLPEKPEEEATATSSATPNDPSSSGQTEAEVAQDKPDENHQPGISNGKMNGFESKSQNDSGGCPSHCLMGCDLSLYFKEPIDTDGLTAHHNEVQERLVRIFASHQAEVQALRRDLHCTRVALLRQRAASNGTSRGNHNDDFLSVDIDSAARAVAMTINGSAITTHSGSSSTGACSDASSTWEAVDEKEANPTLWIPDHAVVSCMKCNTSFWFGRRKHHCRSCGRLFCRDCSNHNIPIPEEQLYHPVRVCDDCFEELGRTRNKDQIVGKEALEEDVLENEANHQAF